MILFAALKPTQRVVRDLVDQQKGVSGARWSAADKLHITCGFFGEVDDDRAEMLDEELAKLRLSAFELQLAGAGHFGRAEPHSIWVGVRPHVALTRIHDHCRVAARRAGIAMEKRKFTPHVTMAYLKPFPALDRIAAFEKRLAHYESVPFLVDEFALYSSHRKTRGPNIYRQEATYPLLG